MRLRLFVADEYKPLRTVPVWLWAFFACALAAQVVFHSVTGGPKAVPITEYGNPPSYTAAKILAFGDDALASKLLVLRLQAFDNQPGISIPFSELDYFELGDWLDVIVALDENSEYPHFLMSKVYGDVLERNREYIAADWVRRQFAARPDERWEWMLHTTNYIKHYIKDDALASEYARELRTLTDPQKVPSWARQVEAFFAENAGNFESAAAILEKQIEGGEITEPQEFIFSLNRLEEVLKKAVEEGQITNQSEFQQKLDKIESLREQYLEAADE